MEQQHGGFVDERMAVAKPFWRLAPYLVKAPIKKKLMCHWQIVKETLHLEMFTLVKTKPNVLHLVFLCKYVVMYVFFTHTPRKHLKK